MRVYYMTSFDVASKFILPERRMKLSLFHELNDPFELQPHSMSNKDLRRINRVLTTHFNTTKGLISFSDNWRFPVMWAHYADKHRGICLGFDVPDDGPDSLLGQVTYNPKRLQFALSQTEELYGIESEFIKALLYTKSHEWAYEREWRTLADLKLKDSVTGLYYVDFGTQLQLREVILGARSDVPVGQLAKLARGNNVPVQVLKARPAFQEFAIVRNKAVAAINVPAVKGYQPKTPGPLACSRRRAFPGPRPASADRQAPDRRLLRAPIRILAAARDARQQPFLLAQTAREVTGDCLVRTLPKPSAAGGI